LLNYLIKIKNHAHLWNNCKHVKLMQNKFLLFENFSQHCLMADSFSSNHKFLKQNQQFLKSQVINHPIFYVSVKGINSAFSIVFSLLLKFMFVLFYYYFLFRYIFQLLSTTYVGTKIKKYFCKWSFSPNQK
jgi:hypothetical protein